MATLITSTPKSQRNSIHEIRRAPKIVTSLPHPPPPIMHRRTESAPSIVSSPAKNAVNLIPQLLLSSLPSNPPHQGPSNPRAKQQINTLLSSRDPLSVPILTVNFKRFIERIEEIVLWKRGWKITSVWIAAYAFFCSGRTGTVDWQANIQAIQNLMGFSRRRNCSTTVHPIHYKRKPQTPHLLTLLTVSLLPMIVLVSLPAFPVRTVCLFLGITPFRGGSAASSRSWKSLGVRLIDDANLADACWVAEMREVELFENERFGGVDEAHKEWSKANLRDGERTGWTRGRDGWSGVGGHGGQQPHLLPRPRWAFVTTEDWRADLEAQWAYDARARTSDHEVADADVDADVDVADEDGWVYTNDAWAAQRPPSARWVRRIWYDHSRAILMS
ncbi:hypothetical protein B0H14DRAFT_2708467 [Mycena olivaceomarginata]|nr:hypothetical protein B0H14DRAFT_2708467 [Mycena olivaceomarginata]